MEISGQEYYQHHQSYKLVELVVFGGEGSNPRNTIQFFNVDSTGNAIDFGDMNDERTEGMSCASRVRAFAVGGFLEVNQQIIQIH